MIFTPNQINDLLSIIDRYTLTFIARHVGTSILTTQDKQRLMSAGVSIKDIIEAETNVEQAFKFGLLSDAIGDANAKKMTYSGFKNYISAGKMFELNETEKNALQNLKYQTYSDVNKLSGTMKSDIQDKLVFADKQANTVKHGKDVTAAAKKAIEHRKGVTYMASELGHLTKKWNKDLGRISDYVMHTAFDEGRAQTFERREGPDALVYKDVYPGACKHCVKHYLIGGIGSPPKIFKLSELKANGTNVGRKVNELKPVVGPLHPWCRCTLERVPFGFTQADYNNELWEWTGSTFIRTQKNKKPKVARPKVKVTVDGKESYV